MATEIVTYQQRVNNVRSLLEKSKAQIALALPRHLTPDRMVRVALTTLQRSPDLLECDPISLVGCVIQASQLGLEIDGILGHAYLVPFNNTKARRKDCQLIVGYKGFLALARRSGEVSSFFAHVVHANDEFTWCYGTDAQLVHKPHLPDPGEPVAVYAVVKLRDGSSDFEVIGWQKIKEQQSKARQGPWHTHLEEMARKTAIRKLAKRVPVSVEFQRAATVDELGEEEIPQDLGALVDLSGTAALEARLGVEDPEPAKAD